MKQRRTAVDTPKRLPVVHFKNLSDGPGGTGEAADGTYEALVAMFGNYDSHGDRIANGFFEESLKSPAEGGRGFPPVVWSHDWMTPPIGASEEAREVNREEAEELAGKKLPENITGGLFKRDRLFVAEGEDSPVARQVWTAMRNVGGDGLPVLREFSFGYKTTRATWEDVDPDTLPPELQWTGGEMRVLEKGLLFETGPTLVGSNPATELLGVKAALAGLVDAGLIDRDVARKALARAGADDPLNPRGERKSSARIDPAVEARLAELKQYVPPTAL
jgi:hypothetical protein